MRDKIIDRLDSLLQSIGIVLPELNDDFYDIVNKIEDIVKTTTKKY